MVQGPVQCCNLCVVCCVLQTDVRLLKEKVKRKQAILVRQEEELASRDSQLAAVQREAAGLTHQKEGMATELAALKSDNAELRAKLEESRQQLQSNEQMIRWLNQQVGFKLLGATPPGGWASAIRCHGNLPYYHMCDACSTLRVQKCIYDTHSAALLAGVCMLPQVTDAQLQVSSVPGSRFKFRPSQLAGTTAPGTAATTSPGHAHHSSWPTPQLSSTTPGFSAAAYSSGAAGARLPSPGTAGVTAASKMGSAAKQPQSTLSFAAFSPHTVTPRQDYKVPASATVTAGRQ